MVNGPVYSLEDHDEAWHRWRAAGVSRRTLVHVDAHHDMWAAPDDAVVSIANFIGAAAREGIVTDVQWVAPDFTWRTRHGRAALDRHLRGLRRQYPHGCPITACALAELPQFAEPVLLDIDVDYFVIPSVTYGGRDRQSPLPWTWPADLVEGLQRRGVRTDLTTIARSVNGGHTPIRWRYLGDELSCRLRPGAATDAFDAMRAGAEAQARGDRDAAEGAYLAAFDTGIGAAAAFALAHLVGEGDRLDEARAWYERAPALDPSYAVPWATAGLSEYFAGDLSGAERAFRRTLRLDDANVTAHLGLGWLAARRSDWPAAEGAARRALALHAGDVDALRLMARTLEAQHRDHAAIEAYEQSLKRALAGGESLEDVIAGTAPPRALRDAGHGRVHARLGRLYERAGERSHAATAYRIALAAGYERAWVHFRLARYHAGRRQWREALRHGLARPS